MAQHLDQQDIMKSRIANVTVNDGSHFAKVGYGTISHSYVYVMYVWNVMYHGCIVIAHVTVIIISISLSHFLVACWISKFSTKDG